jgi:hypothetical protein
MTDTTDILNAIGTLKRPIDRRSRIFVARIPTCVAAIPPAAE